MKSIITAKNIDNGQQDIVMIGEKVDCDKVCEALNNLTKRDISCYNIEDEIYNGLKKDITSARS